MRIRDKEISILFIIGFTFLFILVCTGYVTVSNWLWQYKKQTVSYEYTKIITYILKILITQHIWIRNCWTNRDMWKWMLNSRLSV